jgi:hypothetical protein
MGFLQPYTWNNVLGYTRTVLQPFSMLNILYFNFIIIIIIIIIISIFM